jgi:SAM-dependent methyltransferase
MAHQLEHWAAGAVYEQFMGRWSEAVAQQFLAWLNVPAQQTWLDVGCGTGALTRAIIQAAQPAAVVGLDASLDFVRYASQHIHAARFLVADGRALALSAQSADACVSGLALNFMPQPDYALLDMRRVVKPGGRVAAYVWDYAGRMEFLRHFWDAAVALDAAAAPLHEGQRFPICQPDALRQLWQQAGLQHVMVDPIDIPTVFPSFETYWQSFSLGNFPAPKYAASLNEMQRQQLREQLAGAVPVAADGTVHLIARVWAVQGSA